VSLATELLLLGMLVAAPFFTSVAQPQLSRILPPQVTFFGAWREHHPIQHLAPLTTGHNTEIPNPFPQPVAPPRMVSNFSGAEPGDPLQDFPQGDIPGAIQVAEVGRIPPPVEPPSIAQPAHQEKRPLKISEGVLEGQLISRVEPRYPSLAMQTKTQGTVRLHAIINPEGRITSLDVLSGHPLLVKAALDAVRQWRYRPTLLNGQPVEVETSITVIFRWGE
jgi:protein TonB